MLCLVFGVRHIDIYQHFRKEEHELIDQLIDKCNRANDQYAPVLTPFLDPRGQFIMGVVAGSFEDLEVTFMVDPMQSEKEQLLHPTIFNLIRIHLKLY